MVCMVYVYGERTYTIYHLLIYHIPSPWYMAHIPYTVGMVYDIWRSRSLSDRDRISVTYQRRPSADARLRLPRRLPPQREPRASTSATKPGSRTPRRPSLGLSPLLSVALLKLAIARRSPINCLHALRTKSAGITGGITVGGAHGPCTALLRRDATHPEQSASQCVAVRTHRERSPVAEYWRLPPHPLPLYSSADARAALTLRAHLRCVARKRERRARTASGASEVRSARLLAWA